MVPDLCLKPKTQRDNVQKPQVYWMFKKTTLDPETDNCVREGKNQQMARFSATAVTSQRFFGFVAFNYSISFQWQWLLF